MSGTRPMVPGSPLEVVRTYLEMREPGAGLAAPATAPETVRIERTRDCPASFYRYLYREVGRPYHWIDRLEDSNEDILASLRAPGASLWVMIRSGVPAGFYRLERSPDDSLEIAYLGLLPEAVGQGLGGALLRHAIEQAWSEHPRRVWLHTCTLDSAAALPNYLRRGFTPYASETYFTTLQPQRCEHCRNLVEAASPGA